MKIAFVEIAGFRGFKDVTRFDFPSGFAVLTGRNGVGKSTVLDAIDFVVTGTLSKYAVRGAKGGGLDEHIWWVGEGVPREQYVTVGFVNEFGEQFVIRRSRERGLETPLTDIAHRLCADDSLAPTWPDTLMQTTLIRDETIAGLSLDLPEQARFAAVRAAIGGLTGPSHTERTGALLRAATSAREQQEARVAQAQAELGRALTALTEARSTVERQADVAEAEQIVRTLASDLVGVSRDRAEMLRRRVAERKQSLSALSAAIAQSDALQTERRYFDSDAGRTELAALRATLDSARNAKQQADETLTSARRVEAAEQQADTFASHLLALLDHGEAVGLQAGHCPLCDAARTSDQFAAAIVAARSKLRSRGAAAPQARLVVQQAHRAAQEADQLLRTAEQRLAVLEARRKSLSTEMARLAQTFTDLQFVATPEDPEAARRLLLLRQEEAARLEHALFILEASSAHDRVAAADARVEQLRRHVDDETGKLSVAERAAEAARQIDNSAREVANQVLSEQFDTVMPLLKELYLRLRPHTDWREIETDFGGRVRASLNFTVGDGRNPQFLFSSGQRRAAGIAFLLAIHLSRPWCRLRSLLLDDPVQHVDDYRALNLVEVLSAVRHTGRQVIIAVEDPSLADVLCRRLRSSATDGGRRFDLGTAPNGSATIEHQIDVFPLRREILQQAEAS